MSAEVLNGGVDMTLGVVSGGLGAGLVLMIAYAITWYFSETSKCV